MYVQLAESQLSLLKSSTKLVEKLTGLEAQLAAIKVTKVKELLLKSEHGNNITTLRGKQVEDMQDAFIVYLTDEIAGVEMELANVVTDLKRF